MKQSERREETQHVEGFITASAVTFCTKSHSLTQNSLNSEHSKSVAGEVPGTYKEQAPEGVTDWQQYETAALFHAAR